MYKLRYFRKKFHLNQAQVADAIHVLRRAYGSYETGDRQLPLDIFIELAIFYGISLDALAGIERSLFEDARLDHATNKERRSGALYS